MFFEMVVEIIDFKRTKAARGFRQVDKRICIVTFCALLLTQFLLNINSARNLYEPVALNVLYGFVASAIAKRTGFNQ
jgi:hypothetical protein